MASNFDLVVLRGGYTVPLAVLRLAWSLEGRGCTVTVEGDVLRVGNRAALTDADRDAIRRWKPALLALTRYHDAVEVVE